MLGFLVALGLWRLLTIVYSSPFVEAGPADKSYAEGAGGSSTLRIH